MVKYLILICLKNFCHINLIINISPYFYIFFLTLKILSSFSSLKTGWDIRLNFFGNVIKFDSGFGQTGSLQSQTAEASCTPSARVQPLSRVSSSSIWPGWTILVRGMAASLQGSSLGLRAWRLGSVGGIRVPSVAVRRRNFVNSSPNAKQFVFEPNMKIIEILQSLSGKENRKKARKS